MARPSDWRIRLDTYLAAHERAAFDWTAHNCVTFAAGWVQACSGRVLDIPAVGNQRAALRAVRAHGGLERGACEFLGQPLAGAFAQAGDVVLLRLARPRGRRSAFGVCVGASVAAPGPQGLMLCSITEAVAAWRI